MIAVYEYTKNMYTLSEPYGMWITSQESCWFKSEAWSKFKLELCVSSDPGRRGPLSVLSIPGEGWSARTQSTINKVVQSYIHMFTYY